MKLFVLGCLSAFLAALLGACAQQIHNISEAPVPPAPDGGILSKQDVKDAIISAATFKRWYARELDDDTGEAKITVRGRHNATIHIDYSESRYSITLVSSSGLDERDGTIHRNYNKWIILLDREIRQRLIPARLRQR